jgi:superfamily I DNA and/or RNA helicase
MVVEEAGKVFEAHLLAALSRSTQHLILVGDHEQLRPKAQVYELQAVSGRRLDLDVSLFERLAKQPGFPCRTLQVQRRMNPQISR